LCGSISEFRAISQFVFRINGLLFEKGLDREAGVRLFDRFPKSGFQPFTQIFV